jgi:hypothetical protein
VSKVLLLVCSDEDKPYFTKLSQLQVCRGWQLKAITRSTINTASDVQLIAQRVEATAVLCTSPEALKLVLEDQYDYQPPNTRRGVTLDDYAGSLLELHPVGKSIPARELLVLNPLAHLVTVPYGPFLFERYISKVTAPDKWFPQTAFKWEVVDVTNTERCSELIGLFRSADFIADDIETAIGDEQRRITVCGFTAYFRRTHSTLSIVIPFNSPEAWALTRQLGELPVRKVFQNGMYDNAYKARWNCLPSHWYWDTQHLFHSWYSELPKRLDFITAFSVRRIRYWKDDGKSGNLHDYYRYNALDHWATLNSCLALIHEMPDWAVRNYLEEFPLVFPCLHCGLDGLVMDMERLQVVRKEEQDKVEKNLQRLQYITDTPQFNPGSWQQVTKLFHVLGIKGLKGTGAIEMQKAKATSVFNDLILSQVTTHRETAKLVSTYFVPEKFWHGRLYYSLNPAGTDTLRLASKESWFWCGLQIQNIPRGDSVKQCVLADPGWLLAEIDKAQSEARCVGYLSGETKLIEVLENPKVEFHSHNANAFFGVPYNKIIDHGPPKKILDTELRDLSKRTNHGANYNMGPDVMLDTMGPKNVIRAKALLKLPAHFTLRRVTEFLLAAYSRTYPRVKGLWYESIVKRILLGKKLVSPLGWTRYFFGSPDKNKRDLNAAVAHEPQNLSVHLINREFYKVWKAQVYEDLPIRLKAQIHDSILFSYRPDFDPHRIMDEYMNTRVQIKGADGVERTMFIPCDIGYGKQRWSDLK